MQAVRTLSLVGPENDDQDAIDVNRFTNSDFKDWWSRGILNNTAYVAIAIEIQRREKANSGQFDGSSQKLDIDFDAFRTRWATDDGDKYKQLTQSELLSALAALHKKGELLVKTKQLSLDFNCLGGEE